MKGRQTLLALALLTGAMNVGAQTQERSFYIDYGQYNVTNQGFTTDGADANGHYWNNIHGKGTGALRTAVTRYLKSSPYVKSSRLGVYGEGEDGVTIVILK